ncbi:MAG: methionyl-tRNA formyltransferase [Myxococcota bacterium]
MFRLAFFGTPAFARTVLQGLHQWCARGSHSLELVVCQPDRRGGRGKRLQPPPVKLFAQSQGIPVAQPITLKQSTDEGAAFHETFRAARIDLAVVAAYGRIIPKALLDPPPYGFVNVHASLLPRWRGASPIQRALQAGDSTTGICIMRMTPRLDEGDVYQAHELPIQPSHNAESLGTDLAALAARVLPDALEGILDGSATATPQSTQGVTYAPLLRKEEGLVNFAQPPHAVVNHTRAMHPWPGSRTWHKGTCLRLSVAEPVDSSRKNSDPPPAPGTILEVNDRLIVAAAGGAVAFTHAQLPGKRLLPIAALCNGYPVQQGEMLEPTAYANPNK